MKKAAPAFIILIGITLAVFVMRMPRKRSLQHLVMPGPLTAAHAKYESQCDKCHTAFEAESQDSLCLECHKDVAQDAARHEGFHGRVALVREKTCKACHTEHKGRDFRMMPLDKETFDHASTDFPLVGAHGRLSVTCGACHGEGKKWREAAGTCFGCHAKDDRHNGSLGNDCAQCHQEAGWKDARFDHGKTRFPLDGKHKDVSCQACHPSHAYKNTPMRCVGCHLIDDIHHGSADEDCSTCHKVSGWKDAAFDHNRLTKFALQGRHADLQCGACHAEQLFKGRTGADCAACHAADDVHKGRNGTRCQDCHNASDWKKAAFDHDKDTKFKLLGKHGDVKCEACHKASPEQAKLETACGACHRADDVHKGQQGGRCEDCHNETGWREQIRFDHDLTAFPLVGVHAVTACGECHASASFRDAKKECATCHATDDTHKGTLGADCAKCHNPNGWKFWEFDHNASTTFKLENAHAGLKCALCHTHAAAGTARIDGDCYSCHAADDKHKGGFGQRCDQCHGTDSFVNFFIP